MGEASLGRQIVSRTLTRFKTPRNLKYREPLPKTPSSRFQKQWHFRPSGRISGSLRLIDGLPVQGCFAGRPVYSRWVVELIKFGNTIEGVRLASGQILHSAIVVDAAGAWASEVARTAGVELPIVPIQRQVFAVKPSQDLKRPLPLVITPSGLYFRSETGGLILVGRSLEDDKVGFDFNWDWRRFQEFLWPDLAKIVPPFNTLKLVRGWAGLYAQNSLGQ